MMMMMIETLDDSLIWQQIILVEQRMTNQPIVVRRCSTADILAWPSDAIISFDIVVVHTHM